MDKGTENSNFLFREESTYNFCFGFEMANLNLVLSFHSNWLFDFQFLVAPKFVSDISQFYCLFEAVVLMHFYPSLRIRNFILQTMKTDRYSTSQ